MAKTPHDRITQARKNKSILLGRSAIADQRPVLPGIWSRMRPRIASALSLVVAVILAVAFLGIFWKPDVPLYFDAAWAGLTLIGLTVTVVAYGIVRGTYFMRVPAIAIVAVALVGLAYFNGTSPHAVSRANVVAEKLGLQPFAPSALRAGTGTGPEQTEEIDVADMIFNAAPQSVADRQAPEPPSPEKRRANMENHAVQAQAILVNARTLMRADVDKHCKSFKGLRTTAGIAANYRDVENNLDRLERFVTCAATEADLAVARTLPRHRAHLDAYVTLAVTLNIAPDAFAVSHVSDAQFKSLLLQDTTQSEIERTERYARQSIAEIEDRRAQDAADLKRRRQLMRNLVKTTRDLQNTFARQTVGTLNNPNLVPMTDAHAEQILTQAAINLTSEPIDAIGGTTSTATGTQAVMEERAPFNPDPLCPLVKAAHCGTPTKTCHSYGAGRNGRCTNKMLTEAVVAVQACTRDAIKAHNAQYPQCTIGGPIVVTPTIEQ